jgi:predicted metalloenzyme YecM
MEGDIPMSKEDTERRYQSDRGVPEILVEQARKIEHLEEQLQVERSLRERDHIQLRTREEEIQSLRSDIYMLKDTIQTLCSMIHKQGG